LKEEEDSRLKALSIAEDKAKNDLFERQVAPFIAPYVDKN
jgi:hypothetical protein